MAEILKKIIKTGNELFDKLVPTLALIIIAVMIPFVIAAIYFIISAAQTLR